jgi:predicted dehydrogenase
MPLKSFLRAFAPKSRGSTQAPVRVAVIGAGRMGQYHARHLARNARASLVGIVDATLHRAEQLARQARTSAFPHVDSILDRVEAAVIATPTPTHHAIATRLLEAGVSCLVEKPLTASPEEADALIALAQAKGKVLQVGHIERFNPAVTEAAKFIRDPQFIEVNRLGPYDPRVADTGVVLDLMIHDLDIVQFLVGEEVTRVEAFGAKVLSNHEDIAKVRLHFANGCIADLSASRVSLQRYRRIRVFQKDAYLSLDYAAPSLKIYRKKSPVVRSLRDIQIVSPRLPKQDALALELDHFLSCVRDERTPLVTGAHGRDALKLAQSVLDHLKVHA